MVDADDPAVGRVDTATDPEALTEKEIRRELRENPNLQGDAVREFAEKVADRRSEVREAGLDLLGKRLQPNPSNPEIVQLRDKKGRIGPSADKVDRESLQVNDRGEVSALVEGEVYELGTVDLDEGAEGHREERYADRKHPAQRPGGGGS